MSAIILMCIPAFFVCVRKLTHDREMCVSTNITGGSINEVDEIVQFVGLY